MRRLVPWLAKRDRDLAALRRAGRTAIVMPAMFALGDKVIGNPTVATFAAFGSFAMLLLVDFTGPLRARLEEEAALAVVGGVFVCVGTLASRAPWLAAVSMALVGLAVLFAGVVSSVLASASTSLLLAFILPVSLAGPASSVPDRLAGWGLASGAALVAIAVLWPTPRRNPLRSPIIAACNALALRLRSDVAFVTGREPQADHDDAARQAQAAIESLRRAFFATPYRPTGLSTGERAIVRLVDELLWLQAIVAEFCPRPRGAAAHIPTCRVRSAAASVLERGVDMISDPGAGPEALTSALSELALALAAVEQAASVELPVGRSTDAGKGNDLIVAGTDSDLTVARSGNDLGAARAGGDVGGSVAAADRQFRELVTSLDPSFRSQELSFAVTQIATNIAVASAAARRGWLDRLLGRQPAGLTSTITAARQRASSHVRRHSVWLHNSLRGAVGLGLAVLVASLTGVEHSFWVVLGTLSVLRSNALNTGQSVVRGLSGTGTGFVVGAGILALIGTNTTLLWLALPVAILVAGVAPAVISFPAGQAAFTVVIVVLFNIVQPAGWRVGLLRVEDVAIGCGVSLVVGALFWPRGAAGALRQALAEAYDDSARYLGAAVAFGVGAHDLDLPARKAPTEEALRSAAAARRLDDAFRSYLAERGAKNVPLAEVTGLVNGVVALRLAADAVVDLWQRNGPEVPDERASARDELLAATTAVTGWFMSLGTSLGGLTEVPEPLEPDRVGDQRLVNAVRHDLFGTDGQASATAVRMIWTADHLDAARRLQALLVAPAKAAAATPLAQRPRLAAWAFG